MQSSSLALTWRLYLLWPHWWMKFTTMRPRRSLPSPIKINVDAGGFWQAGGCQLSVTLSCICMYRLQLSMESHGLIPLPAYRVHQHPPFLYIASCPNTMCHVLTDQPEYHISCIHNLSYTMCHVLTAAAADSYAALTAAADSSIFQQCNSSQRQPTPA